VRLFFVITDKLANFIPLGKQTNMKNLYTAILLLPILVQAQLKPVAYSDGSQKLNGFSIPAAKQNPGNPGILILPAWKGIDAHSKDVAQKLSALGYNAFIADIYGEGNYPKDNSEAGKQAGYYKKNYKDYQKRISLALDQLVKAGANADNIAVIGYCFGGTGVLEAARAGMPVKGVVSFHGGLGKDASRAASPIAAKVLVCHGADDPNVPKAETDAFQQEMKDSKADWQMIYYSGAVHAFTDPAAGNDNSKGAAYNEKADKRSWQHMLSFLHETLK
jgi:dienelactone hydrolase